MLFASWEAVNEDALGLRILLAKRAGDGVADERAEIRKAEETLVSKFISDLSGEWSTGMIMQPVAKRISHGEVGEVVAVTEVSA